MALTELITLTRVEVDKQDFDYKELINCGKRILIYNANKELVYDSEIIHTWTTGTPKENTVVYGTDKEITGEIEKLEIKPVGLTEVKLIK